MSGDPAAALAAALAGRRPGDLVLAVSGGGDSTALMHLAAEWAGSRPAGAGRLAALTVDHGLRPEAAAEAAMVARAARRLSIDHDVVTWREHEARGNLQGAARAARYRLMGDWARRAGRSAVVLAHTQDDQAETVLMALARAAGVDGLSAMAPVTEARGIAWLRPFLGVGRGALREMLSARDAGWAEDPGNDDPRQERVRARRALAHLAPLGLDAPALAGTAGRMRTARAALEHGALALARRAVRLEAGDVMLDEPALADAPEELARRVMADAVWFVSGAESPPRGRALSGARARLTGGGRTTLAGCLLTAGRGILRITREYAAIADLACPADAPWDGRWRLEGPAAPEDARLAALGPEGLHALGDAGTAPRPAASLVAEPALWRGTSLLAAPLATGRGEWRITRLPGPGHLIARIGAH
mgnify:CR=1 FL=1